MRTIVIKLENPPTPTPDPNPIKLVVGETVLIQFVQDPPRLGIDECDPIPQELATCEIVGDYQIVLSQLQEGVGLLEVAVVFGPENRIFYQFILVIETMEE